MLVGGGGGGGEGINAINLPLWLQAHGRIVLQYVYKCFRSLDRQLWDIIYCATQDIIVNLLGSFF